MFTPEALATGGKTCEVIRITRLFPDAAFFQVYLSFYFCVINAFVCRHPVACYRVTNELAQDKCFKGLTEGKCFLKYVGGQKYLQTKLN